MSDKHCFTYCGDDRCTCPAKDAYGLLGWVGGALPVLETMCSAAGLGAGAAKAAEMSAAIPWPLRCLRCGSDEIKRGPGTYFKCRNCDLDGGLKDKKP